MHAGCNHINRWLLVESQGLFHDPVPIVFFTDIGASTGFVVGDSGRIVAEGLQKAAQGIEYLIPLSWNKKVKVERYE